MNISATIIAVNEEDSIARAIESVRFCGEVLVVDSGSTDRTVEIAAGLGARVVRRDWPGYAEQKNFAARSARYDWILSIDADEAVGPRLAESIERLRLPESAYGGYDFSRLARYCGRWIRHSGWYPDRKVRLYRRDCGRWIDRHVHESVDVAGPVGHLEGDLLHYTCDTLAEHRSTIDRYTTLAAEEIHASGLPSPAYRMLLGPAHSFVKSYVLQLGFLDGAAGCAIARMAARYVYLKYAKARRLARG